MTARQRTRDIDVLAIGETLVDFISIQAVDKLDDADAFGRYLGGSVTNMALNVVRLGGRAAVSSRLGEDPFGRFLCHEMERQGLIVDYVSVDKNEFTSMAFVTRGQGTADFFICRGSDKNLSVEDVPYDAVERARAVHTSAFALAYEPARSTILRTLKHARAMGCLVSLDPNYHPQIWPQGDDFREVLKEAFQYIDVTKPSLEDCVRLFGPDRGLEENIRQFLDWGAQTVALTMGSRGVLLATAKGEFFRITPSLVSAVDATGAGDAFWAGWLTGLLDGRSPERAACLGQIVAEIKIGRVGHLPPSIDRALLYQKLDGVKCETIYHIDK